MPFFFATYIHQVTCFSIHQLLSCPLPSFPMVMYKNINVIKELIFNIIMWPMDVNPTI
jgi:hypothetical protein